MRTGIQFHICRAYSVADIAAIVDLIVGFVWNRNF
jgi:hypothetical protein